MIPDTRQRIKTEASLLILKYGLRSMSMDDIATHLGMSKKTIYQHFKDKEELVGDIINDMLKANESDCSCNISDSENAIHEIILAMDMLQGLIPTINPSLLNDLQKYHPKVYIKFKKHKDQYLYNVFHTNLLRGIKEKLFRSDINTAVLAKFRVESIMLLFNPEFRTTFNESLLELQLEILKNFLFGLVTPKGYELLVHYLAEQKKQKKKN